MEQSPIAVEQTIHASPAQVWDALTQPELMKNWYFDVPGFVAEREKEFSFTGTDLEGKQWLHLCRIEEADREKKFSHTWSYDGLEGSSLVTWELQEEGEGTRVRLTHSGLESFPPHPSLARENFEAGWNEIVRVSLKNFVEGKTSDATA